MNEFYEGQNVFHKLFGKGTVIDEEERFVKVKFDNEIKVKKIYKEYLEIEGEEKQEKNTPQIINKEEREEYFNKEELVILPEKFQELDSYSKNEKNLAKYFSKNYKKGIFALGTNPIGKENRIAFYFEKNIGLITFIIFEQGINEVKNNTFLFEQIIKGYEEKLYRKLLESKKLYIKYNDGKMLKFPFKMVGVFPNIDYMEIKEKLDIDTNIFCKNIESRSELTSNFQLQYDEEFQEIKSDEYKAILEKMIPEYTTILLEEEKVEIKHINGKEKKIEDITGKERAYKIFALEKEQIDFINKVKKGPRLVLANPGAGKSVMVLSKAYKMSNQLEGKVLLTCYNTNLCDSYKIRKELAGFTEDEEKNLFVYTYRSLLEHLLNTIGKTSNNIVGSGADFNEQYKLLSNAVYENILNGKINVRFKAIFIDEVQLMEPKWLDICYMLLEEDGYLEMYGDLNQDVKLSKRKGMASWQNTEKIPSLRGRTEYLYKNYRNTIEINEYLKDMVNRLNDSLNYLGCSINKDDYDIKGTALRHGVKPIVWNKNRFELTSTIINIIDEMKEKYQLNNNDICIIFPYTQNKLLKYFVTDYLEREFNKKGINYSKIYGEEKTRIVNSNGIILSTIDSSIGLDFKAVILCGLLPMEYYFTDNKMRSFPALQTLKQESNDNAIEQYCAYVRKIYTAASRAREYLYIVNDIDMYNSPLNEIIKPQGGEKYESRW